MISAGMQVPSFQELVRLQCEGEKVGYRGIYIYIRYREIIRALMDLEFSSVLNIGSGYGIFDRLLPAELEYWGVEPLEEAVLYAQAWAIRAQRRRFTYINAPFSLGVLGQKKFDLIVMSEVLEHLPETEIEKFMRDIPLLINRRGYLLVSVPNRNTPRNLARRMCRLPHAMMDPTHIREYSMEEACALVSRFNFPVVRTHCAVLYFPFESRMRKILHPAGGLRTLIIRALPRIASHFIFVLRRS